MNTFEDLIEKELCFKSTDFGIHKSAKEHRSGWVIPPMDVLAYLPCGGGEIYFRETDSHYRITDGDAILSPGGMVRKNYFWPNSGELIIYWIHLRYEIDSSFNFLSFFEFPKVFTGKVAESLGKILKELIQSASSTPAPPQPVSTVIHNKALGIELLALMLKECRLRKDAICLYKQYREHADIIDYVESHLQNKIGVADLARRSSLSVSRFHRVFKAATGRAPGEYIIERRVRKAQILMATTYLSLTEIAEQTGFPNVYYFSRIFKQYSGLTPAAHRRLLADKLML